MNHVLLHFLPLLLLISIAQARTLYFHRDSYLCPDNKHTCPTETTCCLLPDKEYGCCMYPNAVCCPDNIHCCPTGSYCDVKTSSCDKDGIKFSWSKKAPASIYVKEQKLPHSIPLGKKFPAFKVGFLNISSLSAASICSSTQTPCQSKDGSIGCCMFPNAVCCGSGQCCPSGYQCNLKSEKCEKATERKIKMTTALVLSSSVVCPDTQTVCPKDTTCCRTVTGSYGCCPYPQATCCSDRNHCCPNGYTCDTKHSRCVKKGVSQSEDNIPMAVFTSVSAITCPDKKTVCPSGATCCALGEGYYGCCPYPKAVCCSDKKHCCPNGYSCDTKVSRCLQHGVFKSSMISISTIKLNRYVICPDQKTACPSSSTCCPVGQQSYGCCPFQEAVCCHDNQHCCPENSHCDLNHQRCVMGQKSIQLAKKFTSAQRFSEIEPQVEMKKSVSSQISLKYVMCRDYSECPDRSTCCLMNTGAWGCCPYPKAVCCVDRKHCCPDTYSCDMVHSRCVKHSQSINPQISFFLSKIKPAKRTFP